MSRTCNVLPRIKFAMEATDGGPASLPSSSLLSKPFYLGQVDRMAGIDTELHFQAPNVDGQVFIVNTLGYFWTADAMNAVGGPQRPINGIFGN